MKVTLVGLPQAGQQQLFSILTGLALDTIQQKPLEIQQGICQVRDGRVTALKDLFNPKKTTYARIEYLLMPDFNLQGPAKAAILTQLKNADELCYIARAATAAEAVNDFLAELVINDLLLVDKRLETIARDKKNKASDQLTKEKKLMELCKKQLEEEKPLQKFEFDEEQRKILRAYQFLTLKPLILAVNVPEDKINDGSIVQDLAHGLPYPCVQLSVELEQEISNLDEADGQAFMKEMGIEESAVDKMTRLAFAGLGLISFFTVGEDEVRAWPVRQGALAPEAGSVIHSDIARGFVRAEMCKYADLIAAGSEVKLKEQGKYHLKGKDYKVEDGDILSFRHSG